MNVESMVFWGLLGISIPVFFILNKIRARFGWNESIFQFAQTYILFVTMIILAAQINQTNSSIKQQKYTIEIQNQPCIVLSDFTYVFVPTAINVNGKASCYGNNPAHDFQRINDLIFFVEVSSPKLKEYERTQDHVQAKIEHYFYLRDIPDILSEYFEANPNPTREGLDNYLQTLKNSPIKIQHKAESGFATELAFDNYTIIKGIDEWRKLSTVFPPSTKKTLNTTRVMGDLMPRIKKGEIILIYFCSTRYEGSAKGSESISHYIGTIFKSPFNELEPLKVKNLDVYPFTEVKTWVSRKPIPE